MAEELKEEVLENDNDALNADDDVDTGNSVDVFEMSDEEFTEAEDKGELDPPKEEEVTDSNEEASENNIDEASESSEEKVDTDSKDSEQINHNPAQKSRKRHSQDRSLSPEEQEALDKHFYSLRQ